MAEISASTNPPDYSEQRKLFKQTTSLLKQKQRSQYNKNLKKLTNYPLLPYLLYDDYKRRINYLSAEQITKFSKEYSDTPLAELLFRRWLINLAQRRQWQQFLDHYQPGNDPEMQCYQLRSYYHTQDKERALQQVKPLWLKGKSQPKSCDSLFKTWIESPFFDSEYAWQRFQLAMKNGKYSLARYLLRLIEGPNQKLANSWYQLRRKPEQITRIKLSNQPDELAKSIIEYAVKRLARYDASKAWQSWHRLSNRYTFDQKQRDAIERRLTLASLLQNEELNNPQLKRIIRDNRNSDLQAWRIRTALSVADWPAVTEWLSLLDPQNQQLPRWQYWTLRAQENLNPENKKAIQQGYQKLASQRHYYGFLAADKIQAPYQLGHQQVDTDKTIKASLEHIPAFIRARELFLVERIADARREWQLALSSMNTLQQVQAAKVAGEWGWHDRAIHTVAQTPYRDDLELRFPTAHRKHVLREAEKQQIDPSWVMSVIRQESAFMSDARSHRGALGLMQIMPRTGKEIGRLLKNPLNNTANLLQSDLNIQFGAAYLKRNLQRFQGNMSAATAAYNAGVGNVRKWIPKQQSMEADRWVETIRFNETREYVQNIMAYSAIYDQRLNRTPLRLDQRMTPVNPR